jgi:uncharacterized protein (DUF952 family)
MSIILHITYRKTWEESVSSGYYRTSSLNAEGFIHCSTIEQTVDTANRYFRNQSGLVLLCIDEKMVEPEIKYEPPSDASVHDSRVTALFPHIYGPLNVTAVVNIVEFTSNVDDTFVLPAEVSRQSTIRFDA